MAVPSRRIPIPGHASPISVVPQKRPASPQKTHQPPTQTGSSTLDSAHYPDPSGPPARLNESDLTNAAINVFSVSTSPPQSSRAGIQNSSEEPFSPVSKRRRIEESQNQERPEISSSSSTSANVPVRSTETNESLAGASSSVGASGAPTQGVKPKQGLSAKEKRNKPIQDAAAAVVADATRSSTAKTRKPRKKVKGKGVQRSEHADNRSPTTAAQQPASQPEPNAPIAMAKRKYTRRPTQQSVEDAAAAVVEDAIQGSLRDLEKRSRGGKRAVTPEGADAVQITPSEVRMMDLCRDRRTGRKSEREKELEESERAEFVKKKKRQLREVMGEAEPDSQANPPESSEARLERLVRQREQEESVAHNVPNTVIVNGQIQIDETSLEIDRHAAAAAERNAEQLESIEETEMSRKINSATWLKRDKSGGWNELLTERFYDGLRMFGTDFEMISKMFPGRTRHKIKLKFCKEEKLNHARIKATLLGEKLAVDLPEYEKLAGTEFDDPEELEKDLEEDRIRLEEETAAERQAMDDALRERAEQIAAERAVAGDESSAKENRRGKKKMATHQKGASRKDNQAKRAGTANGGDVLGEAQGT